MLLAQITDTHVALPESQMGKQAKTAEHLQAAVSHLASLQPAPDAVVVTGDLVDEGSEAEYRIFGELLKPLRMPVYVLPGNHDERNNLRNVLRSYGHDYLPTEGFLQYAVSCGPVRLVALDTNIPGAPCGELCPSRLGWLRETLAQSDAMTIVMLHHPPFQTGISQMDAMGLRDLHGLREVIAEAPQVERVLCGHLHRSIVRRFANTVASTCPSTAHQIELDLRQPGRLAVLPEPPACQLHTLGSDGELVSHLSYINDFGPAFVIDEA